MQSSKEQQEEIRKPSSAINAKKAKWLSEEALQIAEKRRDTKGKGEKGILECRIPKNSEER